MVWMVTPYSNVKTTLEALHVRQAIKVDGGGSSQLWYAGDELVSSNANRPVAAGLLVFYLQSATVVEQPKWPVIVEKETLKIRIVLKNSGADTWMKGKYSLVNVSNPLGASSPQPLPKDVKPGEEVVFEFQTEPISNWGLPKTSWQMAIDGKSFPGNPVTITTVVIPEKLEQKRQELENQIKQWIEEGKEDIQKLIEDWIKKQVSTICPPIPLSMAALLVAGFRLRKQKKTVTHYKNDD